CVFFEKHWGACYGSISAFFCRSSAQSSQDLLTLTAPRGAQFGTLHAASVIQNAATAVHSQGLFAAFTDLTLLPASLAYLTGMFGAIAAPSYGWEYISASNFFALGYIGWRWRRGALEE